MLRVGEEQKEKGGKTAGTVFRLIKKALPVGRH